MLQEKKAYNNENNWQISKPYSGFPRVAKRPQIQ